MGSLSKNCAIRATHAFVSVAFLLTAGCGADKDACSGLGLCPVTDDGTSTVFQGKPACAAVGYGTTQKVANGEACPITSTADSSSVVRLRIAKGNGAGVCTGTAVSSTKVLTAAHCFYGGADSIQITTTVNGREITVPAKSYTVHAKFGISSDNIFYNDIAIVTASRRLSTPVTPILLSRSPALGEDSVVAGYGQTENGGSAQSTLYAGRAVIDDVTANHVYIDYTSTQAHPCKGDSGGALFVAQGTGVAISGVVSQSDPSVAIEEICKPGDRTLYTNVRDPSVEAFIRANAPDAILQ